MQPWNEFKANASTDEEKLAVLSIEVIHKSKTMDTESEEAVYRNLCRRAGLQIEDEETPEDTGESDPDETDGDEAPDDE
jgi:hypothetical protein